MHFSKFLPLVALASLAIAQGDVRAIFHPEDDGEAEFEIRTSLCVNFERTQPIYDVISVEGYGCTLYGTRNCGDPVVATFPRGFFDILDLEFRSVQCIDEPQE
ncbi:hypothetical protein VE03_07265 [Pseudogymnoascus sp. 23342-1-I1]|nr:hypothetical protein VE03_07265 [Pseudogymnoascus sp. 23342-1-I1]